MGRNEATYRVPKQSLIELDTGDRVARLARNTVWSQTSTFLRRHWKPLTGFLLAVWLSDLLLSLFLHGMARGLFLGIMGASSLWLVVVGVIVWSGISPLIMGIQGEATTADVLKEFKGTDWHLIHGMRFPGSGDIDHVMVGPSGILVFETKWSAHRWPMKNERWPYITGQLVKAIGQAKKNRDDLRINLESVDDGVPIYAICVLWSATDSSKDRPWFYRQSPDFVYGVRGPELSGWLKDLRKNALAPDRVSSIASEMRMLARDLDDQSSETYRRTLDRIIRDSLWLPGVAFLTPMFTVAVVSLMKNGYYDLGSLLPLGALGLYLRRKSRNKAVIVSWFASSGLIVSYLLAHEILFILR